MPVTSANDLKVGNVISMKSGLYRILDKSHVKPGKGGAFVQLELKEISTGEKTYERLRSSETANRVILETREVQFLFDDGSGVQVMDPETFEQVSIDYSYVSDTVRGFLLHSTHLLASYADDKLIGIDLVKKLKMKIKDTEAFVKGQTATGSFKPAMLENDVKVLVPQYMEIGQDVIIDTETMEFVEKA